MDYVKDFSRNVLAVLLLMNHCFLQFKKKKIIKKIHLLLVSVYVVFLQLDTFLQL